ncbi:MAG: peptide ABC transporter substrate-binding protein [Leptotrichiaceae bacterium]|nr:peptide ABC transporter substrate-binding protein [Leptotrichiaceae bacterium]
MKKLLFFSILTALFIVSCGKENSNKNEAENGKKEEKSIAVNISSEPKTIDPQLSTEASGIIVDTLLFEGLTRIDLKGEVVGAASESWEISEDGLTWKFNLRKDAKWQNGDPVTAHDFVFGWLRALNPETASEYAYELYYIEGAQEYNEKKGEREKVRIKALDDYTLEFKIKNPTPYLLSLLSFPTYYPANEKFVKEAGQEYMTTVEKSMGNGPYILKEWTPESNMVLVKNENYWNKGNIHMNKLDLKMISDEAALKNAFKNKELDISDISGTLVADFQGNKELVSYVKGSIRFLKFNLKEKLTSNRKIREALSLAIDRDELSQNVATGSFRPAKGFVPEGYGKLGNKDFREANGDLYEKYNPEKAKKLFDEGMKELGNPEAKITLQVFEAYGNKDLAAYIQEKWKNILGLETEIIINTPKIYFQNEEQGNYVVSIGMWGPDYLDPMTYMDMWVTDGGNNKTGWSNKKYDLLLEEVKAVTDNDTRIGKMMQAEKILGEEFPIAVLAVNVKNVLVSDRVKDMNFMKIAAGNDFYYVDLK